MASFSDQRTYADASQGPRITKGHNTSRLMRRNETFVNLLYVDFAQPQAYDDHFPDTGVSRGNSQHQGVQRKKKEYNLSHSGVFTFLYWLVFMLDL